MKTEFAIDIEEKQPKLSYLVAFSRRCSLVLSNGTYL